ncbi:MAG: hypothetical protein ABF289_18300 [Clostridiales bacterium]
MDDTNNNNKKIDQNILVKIKSYIKTMKVGQYLYTDLLEEKFCLSKSTVLKIMFLLEKQHILKKTYKIYCTDCNSFGDDCYESIKEIENYEFCEFCNTQFIDVLKHIIIFFKVV